MYSSSLLQYCPDEEIPSFEISASTEDKLKEQARIMLYKTWKWLFQIMDSLEIQLNVGNDFDTQVRMCAAFDDIR